MIFDNNTVKNANIIALTRPTDNRTEMLKIFFDIEEVLSGKRYDFKTVDDKCEAVKLKNKADDKQSKLETQNEPLELDKEKESKFEESIAGRIKLRKPKSDEQPDTTDMMIQKVKNLLDREEINNDRD